MSEDEAHDTIRNVIRAISQPVIQQNMPAVDPADLRTILLDAGTALYGEGEASGQPIASSYNVSHSTISRLISLSPSKIMK